MERRAKAHFRDASVCSAVAFPGLGGDVKLGSARRKRQVSHLRPPLAFLLTVSPQMESTCLPAGLLLAAEECVEFNFARRRESHMSLSGDTPV